MLKLMLAKSEHLKIMDTIKNNHIQIAIIIQCVYNSLSSSTTEMHSLQDNISIITIIIIYKVNKNYTNYFQYNIKKETVHYMFIQN